MCMCVTGEGRLCFSFLGCALCSWQWSCSLQRFHTHKLNESYHHDQSLWRSVLKFFNSILDINHSWSSLMWWGRLTTFIFGKGAPDFFLILPHAVIILLAAVSYSPWVSVSTVRPSATFSRSVEVDCETLSGCWNLIWLTDTEVTLLTWMFIIKLMFFTKSANPVPKELAHCIKCQ